MNANQALLMEDNFHGPTFKLLLRAKIESRRCCWPGAGWPGASWSDLRCLLTRPPPDHHRSLVKTNKKTKNSRNFNIQNSHFKTVIFCLWDSSLYVKLKKRSWKNFHIFEKIKAIFYWKVVTTLKVTIFLCKICFLWEKKHICSFIIFSHLRI